MNTDTNYNKLEIIVTGVGDFIITFTERTEIQNVGTGCAIGIGKKMSQETFRDFSEGSW